MLAVSFSLSALTNAAPNGILNPYLNAYYNYLNSASSETQNPSPSPKAPISRDEQLGRYFDEAWDTEDYISPLQEHELALERAKQQNTLSPELDAAFEQGWENRTEFAAQEEHQNKISGAYNDVNDPEQKKRDAHAELFYNEIKNRNSQNVVQSIAAHSGLAAETVKKMYTHIFVNRYMLDGHMKAFDADYDMAQSIQRLIEGKTIYEHDIILIQHEAMEYDLMNNQGMSYDEAHAKTNEVYNYKQALILWLEKMGG